MLSVLLAEKERGVGGRRAIPVEYVDVVYMEKHYTIGSITKRSGETIKFVFDTEDKEKIQTRNWHTCVDDTYIASSFVSSIDGKKKSLYLHNFIMDKLVFEGRGSPTTIDHINGNGFDNRKENLRVVSGQSMQNWNTRKRERKTTRIPTSIDPTTIPKNIWYIPENGGHGERFAVEIKGIPDIPDIVWKTTSSKGIPILEKLNSAIEKRKEIYATYPILYEYSRESPKAVSLLESFNAILKLV